MDQPQQVRRRLVAVSAACAAAVLAMSASPARALADVQDAFTTSPEPFAGVVAAAALLAWLLVLWLGTAVLLTAGGRVPGAVGRGAATAARLVAPAAVRRSVELALGLSLTAGIAAAAGPASAAPLAGADTSRAATASALQQAPSLDWPDPARPAPAASPPPPTAPAPATPVPGEVVVAPGDSLWSLAARALGPSATTEQVAAAWPQWWAVNRDVVGDDPHLIHPGERLTPPVAGT